MILWFICWCWLCSWRTAVCESCWESAARRFWCWRGTTRLTARLSRRCSPAQTSVWGRAKGRQRLWVYKPPFRAALQIPQSSITAHSLRNLDVHQPFSVRGFAGRACGISQTLRSDYFSISPSSCLQSGRVKSTDSATWKHNHFWNSKTGILWIFTSPEHETL